MFLTKRYSSIVPNNFIKYINDLEDNQSTIIELQSAQASFENIGYQLIQLQYLNKLAEIELKRISYLLKG